MSDLDHYATRRDLAAAVGMGAPVYTAGPAVSGADFATVQAAVDQAAIDLAAGIVTRAAVLVYPGTYLEDVLVRHGKIDIVGLGAEGSVVVRSITCSDATVASITTFNGNGLKASLVVDPAITDPPDDNKIQNVFVVRDAAAAPWVGAAQASLRFLGSPVALTTFGTGSFLVEGCFIGKCNGAGAGTGGIYSCYTNLVTVTDGVLGGGMVFDQCAAGNIGSMLTQATANFTWTYDSAAIVPAAVHIGLDFAHSNAKGTVQMNGDVAKASGEATYFGAIDDNATAAGSASEFSDCHCEGALDIAGGNATVLWTGGEMVVAVSGAGAANLTQTKRIVACDTEPTTDNARKLGGTAKAFSEAHARSVQAHADATDTAKTVLTATTLTSTGTAFTAAPAAAAVDTAGYSETVRGGQGGAASAAAGGAGGTGNIVGGAGGAGTGALAAGAGADAKLTGGAAGANGGGGGAKGGDVVITGGAASGILRPGYIKGDSGFRCYTIAKAGRPAMGLAAPGDAGIMIFCTDAGPAQVGIPLWFDDDGNWRDAAGTVVA